VSFEPAPFEDLSNWIDKRRQVWNANLDALDAKRGSTRAGRRSQLSSAPSKTP
jgi:hypothetical protein